MYKNYQHDINKHLESEIVAYIPGLSKVFKSPTIAIFLSQLLYWHARSTKKDGWIYKTVEEFEKETGLSRHRQELVVKKCIAYGFLETKLAGIPATRHFKLDIDKLKTFLPPIHRNITLDIPTPAAQFAGKRRTTTESTQKNTTNIRRGNSKPESAASIMAKRYEHLTKSKDFGKKDL